MAETRLFLRVHLGGGQMKDKYREVCESLDWSVHEYDDGTVELEKYSPAGEDFSFTVSLSLIHI